MLIELKDSDFELGYVYFIFYWESFFKVDGVIIIISGKVLKEVKDYFEYIVGDRMSNIYFDEEMDFIFFELFYIEGFDDFELKFNKLIIDC